MEKQIAYKSGYKYQLIADYTVDINILPSKDILSSFICLSIHGRLRIIKGYAWDGPSGPTIDTKNFMRGSLIHDALYQLIREEHLQESDRKKADRLLSQHCREDGMSTIRAWWVYRGVRLGGGPAADPRWDRKIKYAP